jgi:short-subunit dehydrogenase
MPPNREGAGRTALVTGASAGIGKVFARVAASHGFDVVLTARRSDRLTALAAELQQTWGIQATAIAGDLARPDTPADLVAALNRDGIAIDMLVNNAGYSIASPYRETSWEEQRDFLQVMVVAPCELVHRLMPGMASRGYGRIINVSSIAGLVPGARGNTLYGSAKALLIGFTQSLHTEQRGTGVHVTALCPGFTYTEFHDVTGTRGKVSRRYPKFLWLDAADVAREGYRAVMRNQAVCVPGLQYKAIVRLARLLPLSLTQRIAAMR